MNPKQDPNTPKYNTTSGLLTDYGKSLGLKEVNTAITGADLAPETKMKLPEPKATQPADFNLPEITTDADRERARIAAEKSSQESGISTLLEDIGMVKGKEADYASQEGADAAQKEYDRFASELESEQLSNRRAIERLQKNNPRGLFGGGLEQEVSRLERESLSKQADIAILGNAAKGRFDTAMAIAKRKVESELAPLQAQLDAKKFVYENNKDLFSKAELSTLDTLIKADERKLAEEQSAKETMNNMVVEASVYGASTADIQKAQDLINKGATPAEIGKLLGKFSGAYLDYKIKNATLNKLNQDAETTRIENARTAAAIKAAESGTGVSFVNLSEKQQDTALKLRGTYNTESKDFITVRDAYNRIQASATDPSAAGDLALIFNYMKVLDPGSTVREGEFATAQNSAGLPDIVRAKYNNVLKGERLADAQRTDFVNRAGKLFGAQQSEQQKINDNYSMLTSSAGIPSAFVIRDITSAMDSETENLNNIWSANVPNTETPTGMIDLWLKTNSPQPFISPLKQ